MFVMQYYNLEFHESAQEWRVFWSGWLVGLINPGKTAVNFEFLRAEARGK